MPKSAIAGLCLLALAIAYWLAADAIPRSPLGGTVGADGLPKLLATSLGVLSCILIAQSFMRAQREGKEAASSPEEDLAERAERRRLHLRAFGMMAIGAAYIAVLNTIGYLVSVALLIGATAIYCGRRPSFALLAVVVIASTVFYLLFVHVLNVPLPAGTWPELLRGVT